MSEILLWNDSFKGEAIGGFFVRNELKTFINRLKAEGHIIAGIKIDTKSFNLEVLVDKDTIAMKARSHAGAEELSATEYPAERLADEATMDIGDAHNSL